MATNKNTSSDEFIGKDEVVMSARGRKAEYNTELIATLEKLPTDGSQAVRLASLGQNTSKEAHQKVAGVIRKNASQTSWGKTHKPRIDFTPEGASCGAGIAQVRVGKARQVEA